VCWIELRAVLNTLMRTRVLRRAKNICTERRPISALAADLYVHLNFRLLRMNPFEVLLAVPGFLRDEITSRSVF
jgi:hypothetical protein